MKYNLILKSERYIDEENTLIKEDETRFLSVEGLLRFLKEVNLYENTDRLYYGDYVIDLKNINSTENIKDCVEEYIEKVYEYESKLPPHRHEMNISNIALL